MNVNVRFFLNLDVIDFFVLQFSDASKQQQQQQQTQQQQQVVEPETIADKDKDLSTVDKDKDVTAVDKDEFREKNNDELMEKELVTRKLSSDVE
jgi:hypothetical protein